MNGKNVFQHGLSTIALACLIGLAVGSSDDDSSSSSSSSDQWSSGGTLHEATVAEWRIGGSQDKLATAADWLSATKWKGHLNEPEDFDTLKVQAQMLVSAVDNAVSGGEIGSEKVRVIAAAIITMANDLGP